MPQQFDVSQLTQSAARKITPHDNCTVLDLDLDGVGDSVYPRYIEVRLPDAEGPRQTALWDGSLNLAVNDLVLCHEYAGTSTWRVMATGGNDSGAGKQRVSEVWESGFSAVALQSDADGGIGIGTSTIPHGSIGWAKLAIDGVNANENGPHIQLTTASDDYPLFQMLCFSHDNVHLNFDSYWDGAWKSSDAGSNFKISKLSDQLVFSYDDGIAAGSNLGWNSGIIMDTDGHVGIGIDPVSGILQIAGTTSTGGEAALFFDADATGAGTEYGIRILGDASAKSGGSYLFLGIHGGVLGSFSKASIWIGNEASRPGINCGFSQTITAPTHGAIFAGDVGIGVSAPQSQFHAFDAISGFMVWEFDGLDATVRTIIPNGTGDCLYRLHAAYVLRDSAAAVASGTTDVSNGASVNLTVGGNTVRLRVNANGSIDIARTAGANTIKVALTLRWL